MPSTNFINFHSFIQPATSTDTTPPVIQENLQVTKGSNDWYTTNVGVSWIVTDEKSAITSQNGCDLLTVTQDTTGIELTCEATSAGGTSFDSVTIRMGETLPIITNSNIEHGRRYDIGMVPDEATCKAADDISGVNREGCRVLDYRREVGPHEIILTATENAGNEGSKVISYRVTTVETPPTVDTTQPTNDTGGSLG